MLCNKVSRTRMEASSEEAREEQIHVCIRTQSPDQRVVEYNLHEYVCQVPNGKFLRPDKAGTEGIKEKLKGSIAEISNEFMRLCMRSLWSFDALTQRNISRGHCQDISSRTEWANQCQSHLPPSVCGVRGDISEETCVIIAPDASNHLTCLESSVVWNSNG